MFTSTIYRRLCNFAIFYSVCAVAALSVAAQTPASVPSVPTPQQDGKRPPGSSQPAPQAPPDSGLTAPTPQPALNQAAGASSQLTEIEQNPLLQSQERRQPPPMPSLARTGVQSDNVWTLSLNDALRRALENNNDIEVSRGDVRIAEGTLRSLEGAYDPLFNFTPQITSSVTPTASTIGGAGSSGTVTLNSQALNSAVTKQFSRGGGQYQFFFNNLRQETSSSNTLLSPTNSASLGLTFTQPLWRDRSIDHFRHDIRVQRIKLSQSDAEFRLRTTQVIDQVQHAYWELAFALHAQQVAVDSLNLAREQFRVMEAGVAIGTTAPLSRAEVDTQIAINETALLAATRNVTLAENTFKQLVLRDPLSPEWSASVMPTDEPPFDLTPVSLDDALTEARANRPELRNLRLQADINKTDLDYFRNQTRPRVDLVATVSTTGLAGSPVVSGTLTQAGAASTQVPLISGDSTANANAFLLAQINQLRASQGLPATQVPLITRQSVSVSPNLVGGYGQTLENLLNLKTRNIVAGVTVELPLHNRTAKGNLAVAQAQRDQLAASSRSEKQAVELDVRNAVQTLETARQTVLASREARSSAELQLAGERQLFQNGLSTTFLVFQRENTLATARNQELRAESDFNNALADFQLATGTSLSANNVIVEAPTGRP
jgi:outer membrane protein TolC